MLRKISSIPFDKLYEDVIVAMSRAQDILHEESLDRHRRIVEATIANDYANREDSFEGDEGEEYPYFGPREEDLEAASNLAKDKIVSDFCKQYALQSHFSWLMPQITALVASTNLNFREDGLVDIPKYIKTFASNDINKGIYFLLTHRLRGDFIPKQYTLESRNYSALVPMLLAPHKQYNNIPYNKWKSKGLKDALDINMFEALVFTEELDYSKDERLETIKRSLVVQTGKNAGSQRNPQTTHRLYGLTGDQKSLPWLVQVMYYQIWCAHPANRTQYMILDWKDWDNMPEPLITSSIFDLNPNMSPKVSRPIRNISLPWG